jgi:predicted GNAT family N-acyltransferase
MEVIEFGALTDGYRAELEGDEDDPFDGRGTELSWRRKERHVALRGPAGHLVASAGLLLAEIQVDDGPVTPVVGIGGVIVAAAHRGQGLADRVIVETLARAATLGPDVVILFCHRNRAGLYVRHQFVEIPPPVLVQQPDDFAEIPLVAMWRTLREGVSLARGRVKLLSLPF